jgi:hypothetical protein
MPNVEQPTTRAAERGHIEITHPAFAQIGVSRVSGRANLYDSEFSHNAYMVVRVVSSVLHRELSRDWHHGSISPMIEIALSEAQWASFVSSPNVGTGTPCTLQSFDGKRVADLPDPTPPADTFKGDVARKLDSVMATVNSALTEIAEMNISAKAKSTLRDKLETVRRELGANLPFVAEQFGEHIETVVEKAKAEVHGYMTGAIQRAGIEAITRGEMPLQIEHRQD